MYCEDDLLMLSALQHLLFCPRQCALIHIEQQWLENRLTAEGRILHERVHSAGKESRRTIKTEFDVPIRSLQLGVIGRTDVVEFHLQDDGCWRPFPVEYKRGRPKKNDSDRVQLCAQAMCLEEMLDVEVTAGALFYGTKKRRIEVVFNRSLRQITTKAAHSLHELFNSAITPPPKYNPGCENCSFIETCLPRTSGRKGKVAKYLENIISS